MGVVKERSMTQGPEEDFQTTLQHKKQVADQKEAVAESAARDTDRRSNRGREGDPTGLRGVTVGPPPEAPGLGPRSQKII
ncbi:hypothetical protein NDU88_008844 [Pleurodeles waltl]|uniref:Uncharacterized protein n=1 Tax=Pleurodeles waltl TaxID=8319 RepID=A0AAV7QR48_PLEWA|nr:hypothetical protein NDU88_008844 [Pleurodeles waltl]